MTVLFSSNTIITECFLPYIQVLSQVSPGRRLVPAPCTQTVHSSFPSAASINDGCSASLWLNIHLQRCSSRSLNSLAALPAHTHTHTHTHPAAHYQVNPPSSAWLQAPTPSQVHILSSAWMSVYHSIHHHF
ncbi:hypothetical protein XENOCAPTIV_007966 [Xenoophorus captivus]|uniref:Uncharacterized protein n=1 Tax=Xenoophorus captivus TaxID=1517983 RepID=A0ABV0SEB5_9TELE